LQIRKFKEKTMVQKRRKRFESEIYSDTEYLSKVEKMSVKVARYAKLNDSDTDDLGIVATELVNNAIHHGNKNNPAKKVCICFTVDSEQIELRIKDEGSGFNIEDLHDPLAPENLLKESGRGIFLIRNLMDSLDFNFTANGTEIIAIKNIK
jgi:serine/threonine-protein kinase RsbW